MTGRKRYCCLSLSVWQYHNCCDAVNFDGVSIIGVRAVADRRAPLRRQRQSDAAAIQTTGLCIVRHGGTFGIGGTSQVPASVPRGDGRSDEYQTAPSETVQSTLKWTLRPRVTMVLRPVWMPNPKLLQALRHLDQVLYSGLPVDRDDEDWAYKNGLKMKIVTEIKRISAESFGSKECGAMLLSIGSTSRDARLLRPLPAQYYLLAY
ncbi:hypothetical protein EDD15DRAFT_2194731 [Pisolithus albus]|nr:hypothetical protein EDD15DRAFT_2194731 [Pisolithus albus]